MTTSQNAVNDFSSQTNQPPCLTIDKQKLPTFPLFRPITIEDKDIILQTTNNFKPLTAIYFTCAMLWCYEISLLNENIILKIPAIINDQTYFTLLGQNDIINSIHTIFAQQKAIGQKPILRFMPEEMVQALQALSGDFLVEHDRDYSEYVYSHEFFLNDFHGMRTHNDQLHYFKHHFADAVFEVHNQLDSNIYSKVLAIFKQWQIEKEKSASDISHELAALETLFKHASHFNLRIIFLNINNQTIAFDIIELHQKQPYIIDHFGKILSGHKGADEAIYQKIAEISVREGYSYLNVQEDLGVKGLRSHKESYHPTFFINAYSIYLKNN